MKVGIVGFGRFGKTLYEILKDDFELVVYNRTKSRLEKYPSFTKNTTLAASLSELYQAEAVFYAVSISSFEEVIREHKRHFREGQVLLETLSVKLHPKKVFDRYLKGTQVEAILTHPMFGPDSLKVQGLAGQPLVMDRYRAGRKKYAFWKQYFSAKGLRVVEMTAAEHDRLAARSQGVTHFIGRLLAEFGFASTPIDTLGAKKLQEVMEQTNRDTWELFLDLQRYNPYTKKMRLDLGRACRRLFDRLLPAEVEPGRPHFGIQGGRASFNEQALLSYLREQGIRRYAVDYLYTTEKVLAAVDGGEVDFGLFAVHNSVGGIVAESIQAMARHRFRIVEELEVPVRHFLMKRPDAAWREIGTIMAHPQVFKQCRRTLKQKYPGLKQLSGAGDLIDSAAAAAALAKGRLPSETAVLGPETMSKVFGLEIVDGDLQDDRKNTTAFLLVARPAQPPSRRSPII
jgi:prephenate dehydrogenase